MNIGLLANYVTHALSSFDKQLHLFNLIGEQSWFIDLQTSLLSFDDNYRWQVQLLGTESESSGTWLWAWANSESRIPNDLLQISLLMNAFGEKYNLPELTEPQIPLTQINGNTIALISTGICQANAYYRCPYDGGALFVLIMDEKYPRCTDHPLARITTVFPQAIALLDIPDHKLALARYLDYYGLGYLQKDKQIVVLEHDKEVLTATFDEQNRLMNLETKLKSPAKVKTGETWDEGQLRRMLGG